MLVLLFPVLLKTQVILNEVMYFPDPNQPEWVELYNAGTESVIIQGWTIREDSNSDGSVPFSAEIFPGGYLVITGNRAAFTERWGEIPSPLIEAGFSYLNNNGGDCVRLRDNMNGTIDEFCYDDSWGGRNGRSLERRSSHMPSADSQSWGTSIDLGKGTPGRSNSLAVSEVPLENATELLLFPNPAAEYVHIRLPESFLSKQVTVTILDLNGTVLLTTAILSREAVVSVIAIPSGLYQLRLKNGEEETGQFFTVVR